MSFDTVRLVVLLAVAYALTGRLGLAMPQIGPNITLFWPPTGIAVAALLVHGLRLWPGVAIGAIAVNLWIGSPLATAVAIAVGNTLGPVATVVALRGTGFRRGFDTPRDVIVYGFAATAGMTLPALGGVASLWASAALPTDRLADAALMWWLGDTIGALIVGSALISFSREQLRTIRSHAGEAAVLCAAALVCSWAMFWFTPRLSGSDPPYAFVSIVPLVWAALRFGAFGSAAIALLLSVAAAYATATGRGQFHIGNLHDGLLLQWAYMATIGGVGMMITALQAARVLATVRLAQSRAMLDAIRRAQTQLIVDMDARRALDELLRALVRVTESAFAFVAETAHDREGGHRDTTTCTITDVAHAADGRDEQASSALRHTPLPALLAAVRDGACRIGPNCDASERRKWLPLAIPVDTFVAFPLMHAGKLIGAVGLADREGGYDAAMRKLLEPFVTTIASVIAFRESDARRRLDEQRLSLALSNGQMALFDWSVDSGEVVLTEQWRSMLGEAAGPTRTTVGALRALVHPDDVRRLLDHLRAVLKGDATYSIEHRVRARDGRWIWIEGSGQVVERDPGGRARRMIGTNRAITQRKLAEQAMRFSEEKFAKAFRATPMLMAISRVDDGCFLDVNEAYEQVTGYRRDEVIGRTTIDIALWVDLNERARMFERFRRDGRVRNLEVRFRKKSGDVMVCHYSAEPLDIDGVPCVLAIAEDITQRRRDDAQVRLASKVFDTTADAIVLTDTEDRVMMVNAAFSRMTGFSADEITGSILAESPFRPTDPEQSAARMETQLRQGYVTAEVVRHRKDGSELPLWVTASNVVDESGKIVNFVRVFTDISQLKASQRELQALASSDALTGLPNRRVFDDRLAHALARAARTGERIALLFVDIDDFKGINDVHGHDVGDACLRIIATRLQACVRAGDSVCRLGGDEFAVIVEGGDASEDAHRVAQRIVDACAQPLSVGEARLQLSASVGVAFPMRGGQDAMSLFRTADRAMYAAKRAGGGNARLDAHAVRITDAQ